MTEKIFLNLKKNFVDIWKNNHYFKKFRQGNLRECQACSFIFSGSLNGKDPYGLSVFLEYQKAKS
jgi:hypothetical protein